MTSVTQPAFETLRTEPLSATVPWLGDETYADVASWAVWAADTSTGTSWSHDLDVLRWERLAGRLHARVVFVALNKGVSPATESAADWSNFHSGRSDYKLARAIDQPGVREVLGGAYITDFFKGLPTPTAAALKAHLGGLTATARRDVVAAMVRLLERELAIIGAQDPLLVGIGRDATAWLRSSLPHRRISSVTHYAHAIARTAYAAELRSVADEARRHSEASPGAR